MNPTAPTRLAHNVYDTTTQRRPPIARERQGAYALAKVHRARTAAAGAHRLVDAAEDEFGRFEVCEQRAAEVLGLLYGRPGPPPPHCGPPTVRTTSYGRVLVLCPIGHVVLCPVGHLVHSVRAEDWHGSQLATRCSVPAFTVTCHGQTSEPIPH